MTKVLTDFFCFGVCHVCKEVDLPIKKCGVCKTVSYCSKEHQKLDWTNHKQVCKAISKTSEEVDRSKIVTYQDWINIRIKFQRNWLRELNRPLRLFEHQMWMFPPACSVCYSDKDLITCTNCRNVAYCSEAHNEQHKVSHKQHCEELKLSLFADLYMAKHNLYPDIILKNQLNSFKKLPKDMIELLEIFEGKQDSFVNGRVERALKGDSISLAATLLYAMNFLKIANEKLVIHVVGASNAEGAANWKIGIEMLFHYFKKLKRILFIFVGPEALTVPLNTFDLCDTCLDEGKTFATSSYRNLYHKIVKDVKKPNLVIGFNCGFHEFQECDGDTWKSSLSSLVKNVGVPFVFTSYMEEERQCELARIKSNSNCNLSILLSEKNPFASIRPVRDWCTQSLPVFYSNNFISIVKRVE